MRGQASRAKGRGRKKMENSKGELSEMRPGPKPCDDARRDIGDQGSLSPKALLRDHTCYLA